MDDPFYLQRHPLASILPAELRGPHTGGLQRAQAVRLRQELLRGIDDLRPNSESASTTRTRHHRLLVLRYVDGLGTAHICKQLAISQRQYYYDLATAVGALHSRLTERWHLHNTPTKPLTALRSLGVYQPISGRQFAGLPTPLTSFIGRQDMLAQLIATVESARLVTLTGPPGTGKTRLALELADNFAARATEGAVAGERTPSFPDGILRIPLAVITDPSLVVPAIAEALGFSEEGGAATVKSLSAHLQGRRMLLLLDNLEQVVPAGPELLAIVQACPDLKVLGTSRSPLRVRGEREFPVPPLALPPAPDSGELGEVCESVRLFAARAHAQNPAFVLTEQNRSTVERICRVLDGLPLAIELAAARTRALSLEQIAGRIDNSLDLLSRPSADAPAHQQGLRAALDWSWELLDPEEKALFPRLSVFAGGSGLAAIGSVCGFADPAELMERLVEKSLAIRSSDDRFSSLEVVRQYAAEQLAASGEAASIRQAHLDWCLAMIDQGAQECFDPVHLATMQREHDNIRAALAWCIDSANARAGFRLLRAAFGLWQVHGYNAECRTWFVALEAVADGCEPSRERAGALVTAAQMAYDQGDFEAAQRWAEECMTICQADGDEAGSALATNVLGNVAYGRGDLVSARRLYEKGRRLNHQLGLRFWEAASIFALARTYVLEGAMDPARQLAEEGLRLAQPSGFPWITARLLRTLGRIAADAGDMRAARAYYEHALEGQRAMADRQGASQTLISLAQIAAAEGRLDRARGLYSDALRQAYSSGQLREVVLSLEGLAAQSTGRALERGIQLTAATDEIRRAWGGVPWPREWAELDAWRSRAQQRIPDGAFQAIVARARSMALPEVVRLALSDRRRPA